MNRREVLALSSAGLASAFAGCNGLLSEPSSEPTEQNLVGVEVRNLVDEPHEVGVLIRKDREVVYWNTVALEAAPENEFVSHHISPEEYDAGFAKRWKVGFRLVPDTSGFTYELDPEQGDDPCKTMIALVRRDGLDVATGEGPETC